MGKAPIPIVSLYDWVWWMGFSCKFQSDTLHIFFNRAHLSPQVPSAPTALSNRMKYGHSEKSFYS